MSAAAAEWRLMLAQAAWAEEMVVRFNARGTVVTILALVWS